MIFALAGNQNCGKTTLFNALTGSNQHVGNFPGVTVDQKMGSIKGAKKLLRRRPSRYLFDKTVYTRGDSFARLYTRRQARRDNQYS